MWGKYERRNASYTIGAGGLGEAQDSVTLDIWGEEKELTKVVKLINNMK